MVSRKRRSSKPKRPSRKKSSSKKRVSFTTKRGKRVSFARKSKRKKPTPPHLKVYTNKMKVLGAKYRNGDFGRMKWKSVVKKYMKK